MNNKDAPYYKLSPRKFFAFDVSTATCNQCGWGKLYQTCKSCREESSCDGFGDANGDYCCKCFVGKINGKRN